MKRFHVSKNMFDKNGSKTESNTTYDYTLTGLKPNYPYTCSTNFVGDKTKAASLYFAGGSAGANGVWSDTPKTFNTNASGEITVYVRRIAVSDSNPAIYDDLMAGTIWIMVNEGSTTVPHEPYGDTWQTKNPPRYGTATDVITSFPAEIKADGTNASADIIGNMSQTGTPTPTTPIQPSETGERTANLAESYIASCNINSGGQLISNPEFNMFVAKILQGQTYSLDTPFVGGFFTSKPSVGSVSYDNSRVLGGSKFVAPIDGYVAFRKNSTETTAMLNTGSTALPYEPYGYKLDIKSANTTTPVYLGEVQSTRKIKKYEVTGQENWTKLSDSGGYARFQMVKGLVGSSTSVNTNDVYTSHYANTDSTAGCCYLFVASDRADLVVYETIGAYATADDYKAWLAQQYAAGTPVTIWYVLANETTGIVNEPIRKIGDYADTVSGISIPTIAGANSFDVQTTLKPSEVTVNYKGWHDASAKEWDGSEWR